MSKQVRLDDGAHQALAKIAERTGKPQSICASMIVELYDTLLDLVDDGKLVVERNNQRSEVILPLKARK